MTDSGDDSLGLDDTACAVRSLLRDDPRAALDACEHALGAAVDVPASDLRPLRVLRMRALRAQDRVDEARAEAEALLAELGPGVEDDVRARCLHTLAECALAGRRRAEAESLAEHGLEVVRGAGSSVEAHLLTTRGLAALGSGRLEDAAQCFHAAHVVYRELERLDGAALALTNLGVVHGAAGRLDEAIDCLERARAQSIDAAHAHGEALAEFHLAEMLARLEHTSEALESCRRVLELEPTPRGGSLEVGARILGARLLRLEGRADEARAWAERALDDARAQRSDGGRADAHAELGEIELTAGDVERAGEHFRAGLRNARRLQDPRCEARLLSGLLRVTGRKGDGYAVVSDVQEMLDRASAGLRDQSLLADLHRTASDVYEELGEHARALEHLRAHLEIQAEIRRPGYEASSRLPLAEGVRRELEHLVAERDSELEATRKVLKETTAERARMSREKGALARQLEHAQKMEAVGRLAGSVSHDFNNVLTLVRGYGELLASDETSSGQQKLLDEVLRAAGRGADMTRQLLTFSRRQPSLPGRVDLAALLAGWREPLERLLGGDISVTVAAHEVAPVHADRGELEQVIMNLVVNARDAMPGGGELLLETFADERGTHAGLRVRDTGGGIEPDLLERIFEPFFSTKSADEGTGLGLSTVYGIVTRYDGTVQVHSRVGLGTTFEIRLPLAAVEEEPETAQGDARTGAAGEGLRILLVEDDDAVRELVQGVLERDGHDVEPATTGLEALEAFHGRGGDFELVITDMVLPFLSGEELAKALAEEKPTLRVLFTSGHPHHRKSRGGDSEFLPKPFSTSELRERITQLMQRP